MLKATNLFLQWAMIGILWVMIYHAAKIWWANEQLIRALEGAM